jgi:hypothetical protein
MNKVNKIKDMHCTKTHFTILFPFLASLFLLFFTVYGAKAQLVGTFMEHEETFSTDEEGELSLLNRLKTKYT